MKKLIIGTMITLMGSAAFAQTTVPIAQQDNMSSGTVSRGSVKRGSTDHRTTGMSNGVSRQNRMPDASGQGGSGPGSDQGGTRAAPSYTR